MDLNWRKIYALRFASEFSGVSYQYKSFEPLQLDVHEKPAGWIGRWTYRFRYASLSTQLPGSASNGWQVDL